MRSKVLRIPWEGDNELKKRIGSQLLETDLMLTTRYPQSPPVFPFGFYDNIQTFRRQRIEAVSLTKFYRFSKICF